jgi:tripartite-type tricarboxylate transporter receptor subunit TctC
MNRSRRRFLQWAAGAALLPAASNRAWSQAAQTYPSRPVRFIVGFPAGNAPDIIARLVGQMLSERLGQQFVIENRPGAASNIATEAALSAPADGYTMLMIVLSNVFNAQLYSNFKFNFMRDIAPVGGIANAPYLIVVNPSVPAKTMPEFISYAKAHPGKINYASGGNGSSSHIFGELLKKMAGIDLVHVPYRGSFMPDLLAGQVQMTINPIPQAMEYVRTEKLRAIAEAARFSARYPDRRRIRAPLRSDRMVRALHAEEHARRDRQHGQRCDEGRTRRSQGQSAAHHAGCRVDADDTRGIEEIHRRRAREVVERDQVDRHTGRLALAQ